MQGEGQEGGGPDTEALESENPVQPLARTSQPISPSLSFLTHNKEMIFQ